MGLYKIEDNIYAKETGKYGKSLFASRDFKKDELVFVAFGALIEKQNTYTIPIDWKLFIEPRIPEMNLCQYLCHSCDPNLGVRERSLFVAMRDIKKDEEIAIDYAMIGYEYGDELTNEERTCKCNSTLCRGVLGSYKELSAELKEKYKSYISDYLLEKVD